MRLSSILQQSVFLSIQISRVYSCRALLVDKHTKKERNIETKICQLGNVPSAAWELFPVKHFNCLNREECQLIIYIEKNLPYCL